MRLLRKRLYELAGKADAERHSPCPRLRQRAIIVAAASSEPMPLPGECEAGNEDDVRLAERSYLPSRRLPQKCFGGCLPQRFQISRLDPLQALEGHARVEEPLGSKGPEQIHARLARQRTEARHHSRRSVRRMTGDRRADRTRMLDPTGPCAQQSEPAADLTAEKIFFAHAPKRGIRRKAWRTKPLPVMRYPLE